MVKAPQICNKHPDEECIIGISFAHLLNTGELLTGTPTLTFTPSGLTITNVQINVAEVIINDETVAIGEAVLAFVTGGTSPQQYHGEAKCHINSTPAQLRVVEVALQVLDELS